MEPPDVWSLAVDTALDTRRSAGRFRTRRAVTVIDATHVELDGRTVVNFASNDYLGLSHHARVTAAFARAAATSAGSGAAALVTGHTSDHARAEARIARWKSTEAAVLLSSGYAANVAAVQAIAAVAGDQPVRFLVDKLVHASLIDAVRGVQSATVSMRVFPHNGLPKLRRLLADGDSRILNVVVTESVFSMDGDTADLPGLAELKLGFPFLLLLDEAHGSGVYGAGGSGYAAEIGLKNLADLTVVTLSKAVGVVGGAICGPARWCDAVVNFGRPFVFSTSLPPAVAAAVAESIDVMADQPHRQARVRKLAVDFRHRLSDAGMTIPPGDSPIVPVILGDESLTLSTAERLLDAGYLVGAIRPPTVPVGASRLRITLSCNHTDAEIAGLISELRTRVSGGPEGRASSR
jgi:8-amino-7-oxononanoate synthase